MKRLSLHQKVSQTRLGSQSFHTAWKTIKGYGIINVIRKEQMSQSKKGNILGQNKWLSQALELLSKQIEDH